MSTAGRGGLITVVGSANLDLVAGTPRIPGPGETVLGTSYHEFAGGKGLNQAIAAARQGGRVALVGAVGIDDAGSVLADTATAEGVDVTGLERVSGAPTGRALITVDERGENSIVVVPGANALVQAGAARRPQDAPVVVLAQCEIALDVVAEAMRAGRACGALTVLNPSPATPLPDELLADVDLLIPNQHEVDLIGGIEALLAAGVGTVVVTRGAAGIEVTVGPRWRERRPGDGDARRFHQPAFPVDAIDATGAGDACCGALVAGLAAGLPLAAAVERAAAAGALATSTPGAVPSLPSSSAVDDLLAAS